MNTNQQIEETATSPKAATEGFCAKTQALEKEIERLRQELDDEQKKFVESVLAGGWKRFDLFSYYYGSHSELGEGDREGVFFFHPSVDISRWDGVLFAHGHFSQGENNDKFYEWLAGLPNEHLIEL